ncbi:MAG: hypothetical protein ACTXOH_12205 [Sodalis sp. (in: enterobacteria)]|uniref:hypothetical protein n=1 Tax=Sodalis sp. (in: enterobacteria) TaxID=1898979 RepID=UPI003FD78844
MYTPTCMPYTDVSNNAKWNDSDFPAGRPNPVYAELAAALKTDGLTLSFITLGQDNTPCWSGQATTPLAWAKPLTDALVEAGKGFKLSFGGASNADISTALSEDELLEAYRQAITLYQPQGLDFDLENNLFDIGKISAALARLQPEYPNLPISLTLPTAPTGLKPEQITLVEQLAAAKVDFIVNAMTMDFYQPGVAGEMGQAAKDAVTNIVAQLQSIYPELSETARFAKVGITPMIGRNDDGSMFTLANAFDVGAFAAQHGLSSLSLWSLNRDVPSDFDYVDPGSSSNPEQRTVGEYTLNFLAGALSTSVPTLPNTVEVVDTQLKTPTAEVTSSPQWCAKEIEAAVASAAAISAPAGEVPAGSIAASASETADEAAVPGAASDAAPTTTAAAGSIAATASETADEAAVPGAASDAATTATAAAGSIAATASETADALTPAVAQTQADIPNAIAAQGDALAGTVDEAGTKTEAVTHAETEAKTDALVNGIAKTEAEAVAETKAEAETEAEPEAVA